MLQGGGRYKATSSLGVGKPFTSVGGSNFQRGSAVRAARKETANLSMSGSSFQIGGTATSLVNLRRPTLEGFIDPGYEAELWRLYRDIYYFDPIAGPAIDLMSFLPFSDFDLIGVDDQAMANVYQRSCESLRLRTVFPSISVDYMAMGSHISSLNFDENAGYFTSMTAHQLENCKFTWLPIMGMDPLIDLVIPRELLQLVATQDTRLNGFRRLLPAYLTQVQNHRKEGGFNLVGLEPGSTLYIPRRSMSTARGGTSYLMRMLAIHFLEKALIRGTIDQAHRRQRSILHIQAGDTDWQPSQGELAGIANLFQQADLDPVSSIVATRDGINPTEIRPGADFWKYDEIFEFSSSIKMRALGISENFLTGDATYNNMETNLTVFVENLTAYRDTLTQEFLYDKVFPAIAVANNFLRKKGSKYHNPQFALSRLAGQQPYIDRNGRLRTEVASGSGLLQQQMFEVEDIAKYAIPTVHWHKQLKPQGDKDYVDFLATLEDKGLPIPLRMYAAAGGISLEELESEADEDVALRLELKHKRAPLQEGDDQQQGGGMDFASVSKEQLASLQHVIKRDPKGTAGRIASAILKQHEEAAKKRTRGLMARDMSQTAELLDYREYDSRGKRRVLTAKYKRQQNEKANRLIARVCADLNETMRRKEKAGKEVKPGRYHTTGSNNPMSTVLSGR